MVRSPSTRDALAAAALSNSDRSPSTWDTSASVHALTESTRKHVPHTLRRENAEEAAQTTSFFFFEGVLVLLHRATRVVEGERKRVCGALERSDRPRVAR